MQSYLNNSNDEDGSFNQSMIEDALHRAKGRKSANKFLRNLDAISGTSSPNKCSPVKKLDYKNRYCQKRSSTTENQELSFGGKKPEYIKPATAWKNTAVPMEPQFIKSSNKKSYVYDGVQIGVNQSKIHSHSQGKATPHSTYSNETKSQFTELVHQCTSRTHRRKMARDALHAQHEALLNHAQEAIDA